MTVAPGGGKNNGTASLPSLRNTLLINLQRTRSMCSQKAVGRESICRSKGMGSRQRTELKEIKAGGSRINYHFPPILLADRAGVFEYTGCDGKDAAIRLSGDCAAVLEFGGVYENEAIFYVC
jgi:hypothetical protein